MSITYCPTLDDYRKVFTTLESKGLRFDEVRTIPLSPKDIYVKQQFLYFWRVTKEEYEQFTEQDDEPNT